VKQLGLFEGVQKGLAPEAERLLAKFEVVAEAPGGMKRLRELVLELAVKGRLVAQRSKEGTGGEIIAAAKEDRRRAGFPSKKERTPDLSEVAEQKKGELRFEVSVPESWAVATFDDLAAPQDNALKAGPFGSALTKSMYAPMGYKIYGQEQVIRDDPNWGDYFITEDHFERLRSCAVAPGDVLISLVGTIGKVLVLPQDIAPGIINPRLVKLSPTPRVWAAFVKLYLESPVAKRFLAAQTHGGVMEILNLGILRELPIPLPPLAEQKRIVAKVDELMKLCDDLEARQTRQRETAGRLTKAALDALTSAEGPAELAASWRIFGEHMHELVATQDEVGDLRKTLLDLAVRGFFTSRETMGAPQVSDQTREVPFHAPSGWRWSHIEALAEYIVDCLHATPKYTGTGYPAIRTADVVPGKVLLDRVRRVSEEEYHDRVRRLEPRGGDILYSREGERLGIAACVPPGVKVCISQRMMHIRVKIDVDPHFVMWAMNSSFVYRQAVTDTGGSTSPHINMKAIRQFLVPVPPLAEQKRIVAKVDELMKLCDALEDALRRAEDTAKKLADALVAELLA
jgi:type I restriction enzyme, S subunit